MSSSAGQRPCRSAGRASTHDEGTLQTAAQAIRQALDVALQLTSSTYYAAKSRVLSARSLRDGVLLPIVLAVWMANYRVYGVRKMWKAMDRAGHTGVGRRDQVGRLMGTLGIQGAHKRMSRRTTIPDASAARHPDLVDRKVTADRPNALWVTDLTLVLTWSRVVSVCFIIDAYSRMIVGWRAATNMRPTMVLEALEMAQHVRGARLGGLVCHSDAGSQFTSIRYGETARRTRRPPLDRIGRRLLRQCARGGRPTRYTRRS